MSRPEHAAAASKCSCSAPLTCSAPTICSAPPTLKGAADKVPIVYSWRAVFTQAQKNGQMARWQPGHSRPRTPTPRRPGWAGRPCRGPWRPLPHGWGRRSLAAAGWPQPGTRPGPPAGVEAGRRSLTPVPLGPYLRPSERHPPEAYRVKWALLGEPRWLQQPAANCLHCRPW